MNLPSEVKIGSLPAAEVTGAHNALAFARTVMVTDARSYELAAEEVRLVKERANRIEAKRVELKAPLLEASRGLDAFFAEALAPLKDAEKVIKKRMTDWSSEQERIAAEARRKADEEARRARLDAERAAAEARRIAAETARKAREEAELRSREAEAAAQRERAASTRGERERAEKEREAAEALERAARSAATSALEAGERRADDAMADAAALAAQPVAVLEKPQVAGTAIRTKWRHLVTDFKRLVRSVADGHTPLEVLAPNEKELDRLAMALKHAISTVCPGVEAVEEKSLAISTRG